MHWFGEGVKCPRLGVKSSKAKTAQPGWVPSEENQGFSARYLESQLFSEMHCGFSFFFISGKEHCDCELRTVGGTWHQLTVDAPPRPSWSNPKSKSSPLNPNQPQGWARGLTTWFISLCIPSVFISEGLRLTRMASLPFGSSGPFEVSAALGRPGMAQG